MPAKGLSVAAPPAPPLVTAARWTLAVTAALVALLFHPGLADVFNLTKTTVGWFGVLTATGLVAVAVSRRELTVPRLRWALPVAVFLVVTALATALSDSPLVSLIGLYTRYGGWLSYLLYALAALLVATLFRSPDALRLLAWGLAAAGAVAAVYAISQRLGVDAFEFREASGAPPRYPGSTLGNSAFAGAYLGITAPLLWLLWRGAADVRVRVALAATGVAYVIALWITQSRSGMLALLAGIVVVALLEAGPRRRVRQAAVALVVVAVGVVAALTALPERPPGPLRKVEVLRTESLRIREEEWATAARIWRDAPVLGTGPDTYYVHYPKYRSKDDATRFALLITDKPHNLYLEYLSGTGVLGLSSFLAVVGLVARWGLRRLRGAEGSDRTLLVGWLAVSAAYLAQATFSFDVPPLGLAGWMALGAVAALADPAAVSATEAEAAATAAASGKRATSSSDRRHARAAKARRQRRGAAATAVPVIAGVLGLVVLGVGTRPMRADAAAANAGRIATDDPSTLEAAAAELDRAIDRHPLEGVYRQEAGRLHERFANALDDPAGQKLHLELAVRHHREAVRLQPKNVVFVVDLARALGLQGQVVDPTSFEEADRSWEAALVLDPNDWQVHNQHALMLNSWSNARQGDKALRQRALDEFRTTTELNPGHAAAWLNVGKMALALGDLPQAQAALTETLRLNPALDEARTLLLEATEPAEVDPAGP